MYHSAFLTVGAKSWQWEQNGEWKLINQISSLPSTDTSVKQTVQNIS